MYELIMQETEEIQEIQFESTYTVVDRVFIQMSNDNTSVDYKAVYKNGKSIDVTAPVSRIFNHLNNVDLVSKIMDNLGIPTDLNYKERLTYYQLLGKD